MPGVTDSENDIWQSTWDEATDNFKWTPEEFDAQRQGIQTNKDGTTKSATLQSAYAKYQEWAQKNNQAPENYAQFADRAQGTARSVSKKMRDANVTSFTDLRDKYASDPKKAAQLQQEYQYLGVNWDDPQSPSDTDFWSDFDLRGRIIKKRAAETTFHELKKKYKGKLNPADFPELYPENKTPEQAAVPIQTTAKPVAQQRPLGRDQMSPDAGDTGAPLDPQNYKIIHGQIVPQPANVKKQVDQYAGFQGVKPTPVENYGIGEVPDVGQGNPKLQQQPDRINPQVMDQMYQERGPAHYANELYHYDPVMIDGNRAQVRMDTPDFMRENLMNFVTSLGMSLDKIKDKKKKAAYTALFKTFSNHALYDMFADELGNVADEGFLDLQLLRQLDNWEEHENVVDQERQAQGGYIFSDKVGLHGVHVAAADTERIRELKKMLFSDPLIKDYIFNMRQLGMKHSQLKQATLAFDATPKKDMKRQVAENVVEFDMDSLMKDTGRDNTSIPAIHGFLTGALGMISREASNRIISAAHRTGTRIVSPTNMEMFSLQKEANDAKLDPGLAVRSLLIPHIKQAIANNPQTEANYQELMALIEKGNYEYLMHPMAAEIFNDREVQKKMMEYELGLAEKLMYDASHAIGGIVSPMGNIGMSAKIVKGGSYLMRGAYKTTAKLITRPDSLVRASKVVTRIEGILAKHGTTLAEWMAKHPQAAQMMGLFKPLVNGLPQEVANASATFAVAAVLDKMRGMTDAEIEQGLLDGTFFGAVNHVMAITGGQVVKQASRALQGIRKASGKKAIPTTAKEIKAFKESGRATVPEINWLEARLNRQKYLGYVLSQAPANIAAGRINRSIREGNWTALMSPDMSEEDIMDGFIGMFFGGKVSYGYAKSRDQYIKSRNFAEWGNHIADEARRAQDHKEEVQAEAIARGMTPEEAEKVTAEYDKNAPTPQTFESIRYREEIPLTSKDDTADASRVHVSEDGTVIDKTMTEEEAASKGFTPIVTDETVEYKDSLGRPVVIHRTSPKQVLGIEEDKADPVDVLERLLTHPNVTDDTKEVIATILDHHKKGWIDLPEVQFKDTEEGQSAYYDATNGIVVLSANEKATNPNRLAANIAEEFNHHLNVRSFQRDPAFEKAVNDLMGEIIKTDQFKAWAGATPTQAAYYFLNEDGSFNTVEFLGALANPATGLKAALTKNKRLNGRILQLHKQEKKNGYSLKRAEAAAAAKANTEYITEQDINNVEKEVAKEERDIPNDINFDNGKAELDEFDQIVSGSKVDPGDVYGAYNAVKTAYGKEITREDAVFFNRKALEYDVSPVDFIEEGMKITKELYDAEEWGKMTKAQQMGRFRALIERMEEPTPETSHYIDDFISNLVKAQQDIDANIRRVLENESAFISSERSDNVFADNIGDVLGIPNKKVASQMMQSWINYNDRGEKDYNPKRLFNNVVDRVENYISGKGLDEEVSNRLRKDARDFAKRWIRNRVNTEQQFFADENFRMLGKSEVPVNAETTVQRRAGIRVMNKHMQDTVLDNDGNPKGYYTPALQKLLPLLFGDDTNKVEYGTVIRLIPKSVDTAEQPALDEGAISSAIAALENGTFLEPKGLEDGAALRYIGRFLRAISIHPSVADVPDILQKDGFIQSMRDKAETLYLDKDLKAKAIEDAANPEISNADWYSTYLMGRPGYHINNLHGLLNTFRTFSKWRYLDSDMTWVKGGRGSRSMEEKPDINRYSKAFDINTIEDIKKTEGSIQEKDLGRIIRTDLDPGKKASLAKYFAEANSGVKSVIIKDLNTIAVKMMNYNAGSINTSNIPSAILDALYDIMHWQLDPGGKARRVGGKLSNKYENVLHGVSYFTPRDTKHIDALLTETRYPPISINELTPEEKSRAISMWEQEGVFFDEGGRPYRKSFIITDEMIKGVPGLDQVFRYTDEGDPTNDVSVDDISDGAQYYIGNSAHEYDATVMGKDPSKVSTIKTAYTADKDGSVYLIKTANHKLDIDDPHIQAQYPEAVAFLKGLREQGITEITPPSGIKSDGNFRLKTTYLNPEQRLVTTTTGEVVKMESMKPDGTWKAETMDEATLLSVYQKIAADASPSHILEKYLTGDDGVRYVSTTNTYTKTVAPSLGIDQLAVTNYDQKYDGAEGEIITGADIIKQFSVPIESNLRKYVDRFVGTLSLNAILKNPKLNLPDRYNRKVAKLVEGVIDTLRDDTLEGNSRLTSEQRNEIVEHLDAALNQDGTVDVAKLRNINAIYDNIFTNNDGNNNYVAWTLKKFAGRAQRSNFFGGVHSLVPVLFPKAHFMRALDYNAKIIAKENPKATPEELAALVEADRNYMAKLVFEGEGDGDGVAFIDEAGRNVPYSLGVYISEQQLDNYNAEIDKVNARNSHKKNYKKIPYVKAGSRVFFKLTPDDSIESLRPGIIAGVMSGPNTIGGNYHHVGRVLGSDFDGDSRGIILESDHWNTVDENNDVYNTFNDAWETMLRVGTHTNLTKGTGKPEPGPLLGGRSVRRIRRPYKPQQNEFTDTLMNSIGSNIGIGVDTVSKLSNFWKRFQIENPQEFKKIQAGKVITRQVANSTGTPDTIKISMGPNVAHNESIWKQLTYDSYDQHDYDLDDLLYGNYIAEYNGAKWENLDPMKAREAIKVFHQILDTAGIRRLEGASLQDVYNALRQSTPDKAGINRQLPPVKSMMLQRMFGDVLRAEHDPTLRGMLNPNMSDSGAGTNNIRGAIIKESIDNPIVRAISERPKLGDVISKMINPIIDNTSYNDQGMWGIMEPARQNFADYMQGQGISAAGEQLLKNILIRNFLSNMTSHRDIASHPGKPVRYEMPRNENGEAMGYAYLVIGDGETGKQYALTEIIMPDGTINPDIVKQMQNLGLVKHDGSPDLNHILNPTLTGRLRQERLDIKKMFPETGKFATIHHYISHPDSFYVFPLGETRSNLSSNKNIHILKGKTYEELNKAIDQMYNAAIAYIGGKRNADGSFTPIRWNAQVVVPQGNSDYMGTGFHWIADPIQRQALTNKLTRKLRMLDTYQTVIGQYPSLTPTLKGRILGSMIGGMAMSLQKAMPDMSVDEIAGSIAMLGVKTSRDFNGPMLVPSIPTMTGRLSGSITQYKPGDVIDGMAQMGITPRSHNKKTLASVMMNAEQTTPMTFGAFNPVRGVRGAIGPMSKALQRKMSPYSEWRDKIEEAMGKNIYELTFDDTKALSEGIKAVAKSIFKDKITEDTYNVIFDEQFAEEFAYLEKFEGQDWQDFQIRTRKMQYMLQTYDALSAYADRMGNKSSMKEWFAEQAAKYTPFLGRQTKEALIDKMSKYQKLVGPSTPVAIRPSFRVQINKDGGRVIPRDPVRAEMQDEMQSNTADEFPITWGMLTNQDLGVQNSVTTVAEPNINFKIPHSIIQNLKNAHDAHMSDANTAWMELYRGKDSAWAAPGTNIKQAANQLVKGLVGSATMPAINLGHPRYDTTYIAKMLTHSAYERSMGQLIGNRRINVLYQDAYLKDYDPTMNLLDNAAKNKVQVGGDPMLLDPLADLVVDLNYNDIGALNKPSIIITNSKTGAKHSVDFKNIKDLRSAAEDLLRSQNAQMYDPASRMMRGLTDQEVVHYSEALSTTLMTIAANISTFGVLHDLKTQVLAQWQNLKKQYPHLAKDEDVQAYIWDFNRRITEDAGIMGDITMQNVLNTMRTFDEEALMNNINAYVNKYRDSKRKERKLSARIAAMYKSIENILNKTRKKDGFYNQVENTALYKYDYVENVDTTNEKDIKKIEKLRQKIKEHEQEVSLVNEDIVSMEEGVIGINKDVFISIDQMYKARAILLKRNEYSVNEAVYHDIGEEQDAYSRSQKEAYLQPQDVLAKVADAFGMSKAYDPSIAIKRGKDIVDQYWRYYNDLMTIAYKRAYPEGDNKYAEANMLATFSNDGGIYNERISKKDLSAKWDSVSKSKGYALASEIGYKPGTSVLIHHGDSSGNTRTQRGMLLGIASRPVQEYGTGEEPSGVRVPQIVLYDNQNRSISLIDIETVREMNAGRPWGASAKSLENARARSWGKDKNNSGEEFLSALSRLPLSKVANNKTGDMLFTPTSLRNSIAEQFYQTYSVDNMDKDLYNLVPRLWKMGTGLGSMMTYQRMKDMFIATAGSYGALAATVMGLIDPSYMPLATSILSLSAMSTMKMFGGLAKSSLKNIMGTASRASFASDTATPEGTVMNLLGKQLSSITGKSNTEASAGARARYGANSTMATDYASGDQMINASVDAQALSLHILRQARDAYERGEFRDMTETQIMLKLQQMNDYIEMLGIRTSGKYDPIQDELESGEEPIPRSVTFMTIDGKTIADLESMNINTIDTLVRLEKVTSNPFLQKLYRHMDSTVALPLRTMNRIRATMFRNFVAETEFASFSQAYDNADSIYQKNLQNIEDMIVARSGAGEAMNWRMRNAIDRATIATGDSYIEHTIARIQGLYGDRSVTQSTPLGRRLALFSQYSRENNRWSTIGWKRRVDLANEILHGIREVDPELAKMMDTLGIPMGNTMLDKNGKGILKAAALDAAMSTVSFSAKGYMALFFASQLFNALGLDDASQWAYEQYRRFSKMMNSEWAQVMDYFDVGSANGMMATAMTNIFLDLAVSDEDNIRYLNDKEQSLLPSQQANATMNIPDQVTNILRANSGAGFTSMIAGPLVLGMSLFNLGQSNPKLRKELFKQTMNDLQFTSGTTPGLEWLSPAIEIYKEGNEALNPKDKKKTSSNLYK